MTKSVTCHLCGDKIGIIEKIAYWDKVWHKECLITECLSDYTARKYGEFKIEKTY